MFLVIMVLLQVFFYHENQILPKKSLVSIVNNKNQNRKRHPPTIEIGRKSFINGKIGLVAHGPLWSLVNVWCQAPHQYHNGYITHTTSKVQWCKKNQLDKQFYRSSSGQQCSLFNKDYLGILKKHWILCRLIKETKEVCSFYINNLNNIHVIRVDFVKSF